MTVRRPRRTTPIRTRPSPAAMAALVAAGLAAMAGSAAAQIQPNRVYGPGEVISEPSIGLTLTLPDGWRGALSPDGEVFLMESDDGAGYMAIMADRLGEADARRLMEQPIDMGDGVVLTPTGPVRAVATGHLTGTYSATGVPAGYQATVDVRLTSTGLGVAFMLLTPAPSADAHREAMRELAFSLGVTEPAAQPSAGSGGDDEWQPYLRGRYLARFHTTTGYTESTELWLCSDGTFYYDSQGGGFGGGASGAAQSRGGGRWSATGAGASGTLILDWAGGGRTTLQLAYDYQEDKLYVDGERMLRGANERCR